MIANNPDDSFSVWVDTGRPDLFNDADREFWKKFHQTLKECHIEIAVNSAFGFVDNCINNNMGYGGGGMRYTFWFRSLEDRNEFLTLVDPVFLRSRMSK